MARRVESQERVPGVSWTCRVVECAVVGLATGTNVNCEVKPVCALVCMDRHSSLSVDSDHWKLVPGKTQERTFVVSGKNKDTGEALEALSVDIRVVPPATEGTEIEPADFMVLSPAEGTACETLSSQLLRCLLNLDGTTTFKVTAEPAVEFPPFTIEVTGNSNCSSGTRSECPDYSSADQAEPDSARQIIRIDSDWRDYSLQFVWAAEYDVNAPELLCKGPTGTSCAKVRRARPVELRLFDASGVPVALAVEASIEWYIYIANSYGSGDVKLSRSGDCSELASNSTLTEELGVGKLVASKPFYVCADGKAASVEIGARAKLSAKPSDPADTTGGSDSGGDPEKGGTGDGSDSASKAANIEVSIPPQAIAFDGYFILATQFDVAEPLDEKTWSFRVRLSGCDGEPLPQERVTFTSPSLKLSLTDDASWVANELGLVTVFVSLVGAPTPDNLYPVTVRTLDDRSCELQIPITK